MNLTYFYLFFLYKLHRLHRVAFIIAFIFNGRYYIFYLPYIYIVLDLIIIPSSQCLRFLIHSLTFILVTISFDFTSVSSRCIFTYESNSKYILPRAFHILNRDEHCECIGMERAALTSCLGFPIVSKFECIYIRRGELNSWDTSPQRGSQ